MGQISLRLTSECQRSEIERRIGNTSRTKSYFIDNSQPLRPGTGGDINIDIGKKVLVLEQHDQSGGSCHVFTEKGFEFDIGIHYVGNMNGGTLSRLLADQLTGGKLQWAPLDNIYDVLAMSRLLADQLTGGSNI